MQPRHLLRILAAARMARDKCNPGTELKLGVDVISQPTVSPAPPRIARRRGAYSVGYASDMRHFGPDSVPASIVGDRGPHCLKPAQALNRKASSLRVHNARRADRHAAHRGRQDGALEQRPLQAHSAPDQRLRGRGPPLQDMLRRTAPDTGIGCPEGCHDADNPPEYPRTDCAEWLLPRGADTYAHRCEAAAGRDYGNISGWIRLR